MRDYVTPTYEHLGLLHFYTGGRFWTPAWDFEHGQGKDVVGCITADGRRHQFEDWLCPAAARIFQSQNGGLTIAASAEIKSC